MFYELRIYHCVSGRLPALLNRFDTITLKLWQKQGRPLDVKVFVILYSISSSRVSRRDSNHACE